MQLCVRNEETLLNGRGNDGNEVIERVSSDNDYGGLLKELGGGRGDVTVLNPHAQLLKQMKRPNRKTGSRVVRN